MSEVLIYETESVQMQMNVRPDAETVCLPQEQMAALFGRERSVVPKHLRNVFKEGELDVSATCAKFAQVQVEGARTVTRGIEHDNLDVVISVGYRVKSQQGVQFYPWATRTLREHLVQGYMFNSARLAERGIGGVFGHSGQHRANHVWQGAVSRPRRKCGALAAFCHQGSSVFGRQQAHRFDHSFALSQAGGDAHEDQR